MCPSFSLAPQAFPSEQECPHTSPSIHRILGMTTSSITPRCLILAGGFALAIASTPAVAIATQSTHSVPLAACDPGEDEDVFTTVCTPFMVPNSPQGFTFTAANPDIPEIDGVPCIGRDSGACIGLSGERRGRGAAAGAPVDHQLQPITKGRFASAGAVLPGNYRNLCRFLSASIESTRRHGK
jgi:hypothetical protein